jgi:hypothetical protein
MGKYGDRRHQPRGTRRNNSDIATSQRLGLRAIAQTIEAPDFMLEITAISQLGFGSLGRPSTISPMMLR